MSVNQYDLRFYGSANMSDTTGTTGGAAAFGTKVFFADLTSGVIPSVVSSSGSDTATTIAVYSLTSSGILQNETISLAGTTVTAGTLTASRLMKGIQGGTTPIGDIAILGNNIITGHTLQAGTTFGATLNSGDGASCVIGDIIRITNNTPTGVQYQLRTIIGINTDTIVVNRPWSTIPSSSTTYDIWNGMLFDISPNQITNVRRVFYGAYAQAISGSTNTWYEKVFVVNDNTTTALTTAAVLKQIDPSGLYSGSGALNFALCTSLNDTSTISTNLNPGSPPSSITSYSSGPAPQTINVPGSQVLPNGSTPNASGAQGIWLQLVLVAGEPTINSFIDMRILGLSI